MALGSPGPGAVSAFYIDEMVRRAQRMHWIVPPEELCRDPVWAFVDFCLLCGLGVIGLIDNTYDCPGAKEVKDLAMSGLLNPELRRRAGYVLLPCMALLLGLVRHRAVTYSFLTLIFAGLALAAFLVLYVTASLATYELCGFPSAAASRSQAIILLILSVYALRIAAVLSHYFSVGRRFVAARVARSVFLSGLVHLDQLHLLGVPWVTYATGEPVPPGLLPFADVPDPLVAIRTYAAIVSPGSLP